MLQPPAAAGSGSGRSLAPTEPIWGFTLACDEAEAGGQLSSNTGGVGKSAENCQGSEKPWASAGPGPGGSGSAWKGTR